MFQVGPPKAPSSVSCPSHSLLDSNITVRATLLRLCPRTPNALRYFASRQFFLTSVMSLLVFVLFLFIFSHKEGMLYSLCWCSIHSQEISLHSCVLSSSKLRVLRVWGVYKGNVYGTGVTNIYHQQGVDIMSGIAVPLHTIVQPIQPPRILKLGKLILLEGNIAANKKHLARQLKNLLPYYKVFLEASNSNPFIRPFYDEMKGMFVVWMRLCCWCNNC